MSQNASELFDEKLCELIAEAAAFELAADEATTAMKNLETFSKCRPPEPELEPISFVPTTKWEKFKHGLEKVWDNETTRTTIKVAGPLLATVAVVVTTIHRDHVIEKTALQQANQPVR